MYAGLGIEYQGKESSVSTMSITFSPAAVFQIIFSLFTLIKDKRLARETDRFI